MSTTYAGFTGVPGGMNSGLDPLLLKPTEFVSGINLSVRGGFASTRGGFIIEKDHSDVSGAFRGADTWRLNSGDWQVLVIGDTVVIYDVDNGTRYTFPGMFTVSSSWCFFEQADRWMVIQSGGDRPAVFEILGGVPSLYGRDPTAVCLVQATVMQYLHGRLFMVPVQVPALTPDPTASPTAVPDPDPAAGDGRLVFCAADVRDNLNPEYLFRMTEHRTVATGGVFNLPAEFGFIEGLSELRGAATGTGVGPLLVFAREGVSAFDVSVPRSEWLTTSIGQVLFRGAGTRSSRSIVPINDDVGYIDVDGQVRFLRYDKTDLSGAGGVLYNTPRSNEMRYWIEQGDPQYLGEVSSTFVDNRFFWTLIGDSDKTYAAVGVLDTIPAYTMAAQEPPAYYGVWTGFDFHQVVSARKAQKYRLFAYARKAAGGVVFLRYDDDTTLDPLSTPIVASLTTKTFDFALDRVATATSIKRLDYCEFWLQDITRNTTVSVYYRLAGYSTWTLMGTKAISVPSGPPQSRRQLKISLDQSTTDCNTVTNKPVFVGDRFQFLIRIQGSCMLEAFRAVATVVSEEEPDICDTDNSNGLEYPVDTLAPDFDYEVAL